MNGASKSEGVLVLRTSSVSSRQRHVIEALRTWFGLTIEVETGVGRKGASSLEARSGAKWTWQDHDMLRDETSLETPVIWGKWQDQVPGVTLMLPCWTAPEEGGGQRLAEGEAHLEFDPFGVTFWGLTCWAEQAGEWPLDEHGRPTTSALPWRSSEGQAHFLGHSVAMSEQHHWPWVELMWAGMFESMGLKWQTSPTFRPTVDIDVAFKHLGRSRWKSNLLQLRDLCTGRWPQVVERKQVCSGQVTDPYDTYAFFNEVHRNAPLRWFVLAAERHLPHDVGLNPEHEVLPALVANLASAHATAGVSWHPGYVATDDEAVRKREHARISGWPGMDMSAVRTHFLRGQSGAWWRLVESMGIEHDMSLGWARDVGFRSGISRPFQAYDLQEDRALDVTIHPVAVMDVGMRVGLAWSPEEARSALSKRMAVVEAAGGHWMSCWHNTSVSEDEPWLGWRATYLHMVEEAREWS